MSQPQTHTSLPLASPASASSSTLITTPLPIGRSKESLRLPPTSTSIPEPPLTARPPPRLMGTAPPPTRMSASGFVEPHHSNVPRRVRTRTKTSTSTRTRTASGPLNDNAQGGSGSEGSGSEEVSEEKKERQDRKVKQLRKSVKEALTPGRRWSDSEDGDSPTRQGAVVAPEPEAAPAATEPAANPPIPIPTTSSLPTSQTSYLYPGAIPNSSTNDSLLDPNTESTPARPTPTSSRNLNTSRTPLHLLSLKLPPTPGPGSPTEARPTGSAPVVNGVQPGLPGLPATADVVGPAQSAPAFGLPAGTGFAVPPPKTPQVPQTSTLRPSTLPRRRKPQTPAAKPTVPTTTPAPAPAASDSTSSSRVQNALATQETRDKAHISTPPPSQLPRREMVTRDVATPTPTPGPTPGPSRTPGVGVRFHGHHSGSGSSEASSSKLNSKLKSKDNGNGNSNVRLGRRNTVSVAKDGRDGRTTPRTGEGKRSRSLVDPRSATRTPTRTRRGDGGSRSRARSTQRGEVNISPSKARGKGRDLYDGENGEDNEDGNADLNDDARARRASAREERRRRRAERQEKRRVERQAREERRRVRREVEESMCVQRLGCRAGVEVAFLDGEGDEIKEEEGVYVLLRVVDPEEDTDEEDEDEDWLDSDSDLVEATPSADATPEASNAGQPIQPRVDESTTSKELRLHLPTDLSKHIDGLPALSTAQIREGCEFIHRILSSTSAPPVPTTTYGATVLARPCRVRVLAPRARPEDAWAVALCYQAGVENAVVTAAGAHSTPAKTPSITEAPILPSSTTTTSSSSGAARLIASKSTSGSPAGQAARRLSVPVPVPPLALVRGEDGEVEGVVEVEVDVETIDDAGDVGGDVVVDVDGDGDVDGTVAPLVAPVVSEPESPPDPTPNSAELDEDTFMLHPTYTYSSVHALAMQLLDEGAGEWHTRGKQWEERVERMGYAAAGGVGAGVGVKKVHEPVVGGAEGDCDDADEESDEDVEEETGEEEWDGEEDGEEGDSEREEDSYDEYAEEDDEELKSAGARQGSQSTGERGANRLFADGDDDGNGEYERGRTNEPHTRTGHHGVPMPSKYEEPSSAFVSSVNGRSKSRGARSKSKSKAAASQSKSRARSVSMSASGSKANGIGTRKSRLSMSYDPFLDNDGDVDGVVDKATRKARHAEARQARLRQRRAQKEAEEAQAYGGIRMEWRGVLSFDGLQKLVDVWAPT